MVEKHRNVEGFDRESAYHEGDVLVEKQCGRLRDEEEGPFEREQETVAGLERALDRRHPFLPDNGIRVLLNMDWRCK
jgi:hypothetical protein